MAKLQGSRAFRFETTRRNRRTSRPLFRAHRSRCARFRRRGEDFHRQNSRTGGRAFTTFEDERDNVRFGKAFSSFFVVCQNALNPQIKESAVKKMLVQHLLTVRLFKKIFDNEKWFQNNIIAGELGSVIEALSSRSRMRNPQQLRAGILQ
ncbi:hypothetical protein [Abditibacterium utsteinense]|uniref:hypothetical protein n=1 Tax=Abditibacterium utsteinense TaxID=1960156 RepID=UPI003CC5459A